MTEEPKQRSVVGKVAHGGEVAVGRLMQELLAITLVNRSIATAMETRERALRAQEAAMGALNLPSASDLERLTRRLRSVSQRLEGIEDGLDRLEQRLERAGTGESLTERLDSIEASLSRLESGADGGSAAAEPADGKTADAKAKA